MLRTRCLAGGLFSGDGGGGDGTGHTGQLGGVRCTQQPCTHIHTPAPNARDNHNSAPHSHYLQRAINNAVRESSVLELSKQDPNPTKPAPSGQLFLIALLSARLHLSHRG